MTGMNHSMIIAIANSKGGVGKTTIAAHAVAWLSLEGFSVALADCDTSGHSSRWIAEALPEISVFRFHTLAAISSEIPLLAKRYEVVVADGPAGFEDEFTTRGRALLEIADYALIPARPGFLEISSLQQNTAIVAKVREKRGGKPATGVVMTHANSRFKLVREMHDAANELGFKFIEQTISLCQSYAQAPGEGRFIWEMGKRAESAAREMDALFRTMFGPALKNKTSAVQRMLDTKQPVRRRIANG